VSIPAVVLFLRAVLYGRAVYTCDCGGVFCIPAGRRWCICRRGSAGLWARRCRIGDAANEYFLGRRLSGRDGVG
jgi:hypothetical protein